MQKTIGKYNSSSSVKSKVSKKVFLSMLDETKESEGRLFYSKQAMRLELLGEQKSLIVMNKDAIWLETSGVVDGDKTQVTKIIAKDLARQSRAPIVLIFGQSKILSEFKVKSDTTANGVRKISLTPKDLKKWKDLQNFYAEVNIKGGVIELAQYEDELGNRTTFRFSNTEFNAGLDKKIFDYKPPQDAEVTIYK
ncbi:MAG: outer-membrane lipoprotein carrier protein LolA [Bdellovibrionota bacterium]